MTTKLLFITKRAKLDIETAISLLTKKVSKSDKDDWEKLKRVLIWCKNTINDARVVGATSFTDMLTWIDAAYAVHTSIKIHTGGVMPMVIGAVHSKSSTQKLNTKEINRGINSRCKRISTI